MSRREDESTEPAPDDVEDLDEQSADSTGQLSASRESQPTPEDEAREGWIDLEREARRKMEH